MTKEEIKQKLTELNEKLAQVWDEILSASKLVQAINEKRIDQRLFALYMLETYHYTRHNARNQALVGVRSFQAAPSYIKFCFDHAAEETGHELMALHDVKSMGLNIEENDLPSPLPATEVLIGYLYWISMQGNPLQRLGYSFWAENCYQYINPIIHSLQEQLGLKSSQLTFFIAHSTIDEKHAEEVNNMIITHCKSEDDLKDVEKVMETSLRLTGQLLNAVYDAYVSLEKGSSDTYQFLNVLKKTN
ncbi:iron-containing redox enzyme family protein [Zooshikella sp. RANM57]|uniref:iron-containing redox enzyme family protein n=1 Tax=Zooshikella sp. RANM57 TaxID=3425863 RepID=UPI003D6F9437